MIKVDFKNRQNRVLFDNKDSQVLVYEGDTYLRSNGGDYDCYERTIIVLNNDKYYKIIISRETCDFTVDDFGQYCNHTKTVPADIKGLSFDIDENDNRNYIKISDIGEEITRLDVEKAINELAQHSVMSVEKIHLLRGKLQTFTGSVEVAGRLYSGDFSAEEKIGGAVINWRQLVRDYAKTADSTLVFGACKDEKHNYLKH